MNQEHFEKLVEEIREQTTKLLVEKGREYAGDADRLANFKRGAQLTGTEPLTVLFVYMSKHYDALATHVRAAQEGEVVQASEPITGRLADLINYCVLAWALIEEGHYTPTERLQREKDWQDKVAQVKKDSSARLREDFLSRGI